MDCLSSLGLRGAVPPTSDSAGSAAGEASCLLLTASAWLGADYAYREVTSRARSAGWRLPHLFSGQAEGASL